MCSDLSLASAVGVDLPFYLYVAAVYAPGAPPPPGMFGNVPGYENMAGGKLPLSYPTSSVLEPLPGPLPPLS